MGFDSASLHYCPLSIVRNGNEGMLRFFQEELPLDRIMITHPVQLTGTYLHGLESEERGEAF